MYFFLSGSFAAVLHSLRQNCRAATLEIQFVSIRMDSREIINQILFVKRPDPHGVVDIHKLDRGDGGRAGVGSAGRGDADRPGFAVLHQVHFGERVRCGRRRAMSHAVAQVAGPDVSVKNRLAVGGSVIDHPDRHATE